MSKNEFPPCFSEDELNIAIDFDGVIHNNDRGWHDGTCYGEPIEGALDAIKILSKSYRVIIFTAKAKSDRPLVNGKTGIDLVAEWLDKYGVLSYISSITAEKPRAFVYIDDKGYRFENWGSALNFLREIKK